MAIRLDWSNIGQGLKDVAGAVHERRYQQGAEDIRQRYSREPREVEAGQWYDFYDQTGVGPAAPPQYVPTDGAAPETPPGLTRQATADMRFQAPGAEQMYATREEAAAAMPVMSRADKFYELADVAEKEKMYDRAKEYRAQGYQQENLDSLSALRALQTDVAQMEIESARFQTNLDKAARDGLPGLITFANQLPLDRQFDTQADETGVTVIDTTTGEALFPPQASEAAALDLAYSFFKTPGAFGSVLKAEEDALLARNTKQLDALRTERDALGSNIKDLQDMVKTGYDRAGKAVPKEKLAEFEAQLAAAQSRYDFITNNLLLKNPIYTRAVTSQARALPPQAVDLYINGDPEARLRLESVHGPDVMRLVEEEYKATLDTKQEAGEEETVPSAPGGAGLTYPSELVDPEAPTVSQAFQRSQASGRVNEMRRSIVQKLADTKPSRGLPGFTDQPTLRERERVNTIIEWYQSPAAERLFTENPDLINPAFSDPEGFYREYGREKPPGMKNGGLVRRYARGGKVTDEDIARYNSMIDEIAPQYGVDPDFMRRLVDAESSYNPRAKSGAGAMGLGQLMPGTAKDMGVKDPYDPEQNLRGAAKYLGWLQGRHDNPAEVLAAYNAGTGRVREKGFDWVYENYPETRNYINKILPDYQGPTAPQVTGQTPRQAQANGVTQPPRTDITLPPGAPAPMGPRTGRTPSQMPDRGGLRGAMDRGSSYLGEETDTRENRRRIEKSETPKTRGDYLQRAGDALSRGSRRPAYVEPERFAYDPLGSGAAMETLERSRVRGPQFGLAMARGGQVRDYRDGGDVDGPGTKTSDSIPARLSDGEYVVNADAVAMPGVEELLEYINNLGLQIRDLDQQRRA